MYCSECGAKIGDNAKFCRNCGCEVSGMLAATAEMPGPGPQVADSPATAEMPGPGPQIADSHATAEVPGPGLQVNENHVTDSGPSGPSLPETKGKKLKLNKFLFFGTVALLVLAASFFGLRYMAAERVDSHIRLAYKLIDEGSYEEAAVEFNKAISIDSSNMEAKLGLAKVDLLTGNVSDAEAAFIKITKAHPKSPEAYIELYYLYISVGDNESALKIAEEGAKNTGDVRLERLLEELLDKKMIVTLVDTEDGDPVVDASIEVFAGDDQSKPVATAKSFEDGTFALKLEPGSYRINVEMQDYLPIDINQEISADKDLYKFTYEAIRKPDDPNAARHITGTLVNAITRGQIAKGGISVSFVKGIYSAKPEGNLESKSAETDETGKFQLDLTSGYYTAFIEDIEGYQSRAILVSVYKDAEFTFDIVPVIKEGQMRKLVGQVVDADTLTGITNARITAYYGSGYTYKENTVSTDGTGQFSMELLPGTYNVVVSCKDYISIMSYQTVSSDDVTYQARLRAVKRSDGTNGTVKGKVINAFNGSGVVTGESKLLFIPGVYGSIPSSLDTKWSTGTDANGEYSISLPAGNYTVVATGISGYSSSFAQAISIGNKELGDQNVSVTPIIPDDQIRIILTWSDTPTDLDSHLLGPGAQGQQFHTAFYSKTFSYGTTRYADLDLDDTSGYGPETTTIYKQVAGTYTFAVHDYSNRSNSSDTYLSASSATVTVYWGNSRKYTFNVPPNRTGTYWTVFRIVGSELTTINEISNQILQ